jgi:RNA polymerase sigma-70 factor (ECF subfamily)
MQQEHTLDVPLVVTRASEGDQLAFASLVRKCQGTMYSAAMAILRNEQDALDAMQDAALKAWRKLPSLKEGEYFQTWITRITIRCATDIARKRKPEPLVLTDVPAPREHTSERMDIERAMDALDEKTRLCATLYYLEDMPVEHVARMVGVRVGTVKSRLYRARAKLRQVLEGYAYDE